MRRPGKREGTRAAASEDHAGDGSSRGAAPLLHLSQTRDGEQSSSAPQLSPGSDSAAHARFPAQLLRQRTWKRAQLTCTCTFLPCPVPRRCSLCRRAAREGYVGKDCGLCATKPKRTVRRPGQELVLSTSKVEKYL